jgi:transcriptional regulator with XRE-family HTH domain
MLTFYEMVGQRILESLENKHWKQVQLAEKIGISKQVLNKILKGEKNTTILEIRNIADILEVPIESLLKPIDERIYIVEEEKEEELVPFFMGQVTSEEGKAGLNKAFDFINLLIEYEEVYQRNKAYRNQVVSFKGIKQVRNFDPNLLES